MNFFLDDISERRQKIHFLIFFYTLCLIAVTLPFFPVINSVAIIILAVNWIAEGKFRQKIGLLRDNRFIFLFSLFYLLHIVALLYTSNFEEGTFQLEKKLSLLIFPVIIGTSTRITRTQLRTILKYFVVSVVTASLICLVNAFYRNYNAAGFSNVVWFYFTYNDLTDVLDLQPNYLALYTAFSVFIISYFLLTQHTKMLVRVSLLILTFYLFIFLLLLSGRTVIFATVVILFAGSFYFFLRNGKLIKGFAIITSALIIAALIGYQIPIIKERTFQTFGLQQDTKWINQYGDGLGGLPSVRLMKWQCAWNIIKDHWLIGVGPGDVQDLLQIQYEKINFEVALDQRFNPHNQFLQTWIGIGIPGLLSLIIMFVWPAAMANRQQSYLYLAMLLLFFLCCITESMFERQWGIVFYALFNSLFFFQDEQFSGQ